MVKIKSRVLIKTLIVIILALEVVSVCLKAENRPLYWHQIPQLEKVSRYHATLNVIILRIEPRNSFVKCNICIN